MKEREELENPVKLPKAWIEADKRRARKIERAKLPLCKRWFPAAFVATVDQKSSRKMAMESDAGDRKMIASTLMMI